MCMEMLVTLVDTVVDKERIIGKNGEPRRKKAQGVADRAGSGSDFTLRARSFAGLAWWVGLGSGLWA
jgi:hypothetical protein